ncbi:Phytochrome-like protein cph1 [Paraglaciecola mesophila]|uniref:histidine kinase n=1 Tax=Paraglaciecola mesophila TaxID=197222 RepID=A0A857JPY1_9ALTE|nr:HAMP domain-containing sensor histidine kinase [Paraglaciecola mesophila]QHJ13121.1 Phytochrome-like protein cph1 [Paraglaciecola mesophila]
MKISSKLMLIVMLTIFEISMTLLAVFEISKGAKFHQLNSLHFKYIVQYSELINDFERSSTKDVSPLINVIINMRQQPIECVEAVSWLNVIIMQQINTYHAVDICRKDIDDANNILKVIANFEAGELSAKQLIVDLRESAKVFNQNSALFEKPITDTVTFIMRVAIPFLVAISLFNILFISYMSKNISGSIRNAIRLLKRGTREKSLIDEIDSNVTGELKTLLLVAKERLANEVLVAEINQKLEKLVEQRTQSLTRANEELAQFAYRASHDLKAPLTSSKLLTQFIIEDIESGNINSAIDDANKIYGQMEKLEKLVVGILSLTEADAIDDTKTSIDLASIIDDIRLRLLEPRNLANGFIRCTTDITSEFTSEKVRIVQILENLISNSEKYKDEAKPEAPFINITLQETDLDYRLVVEDNGLGIPANRHDEVFQMFKRFHPEVSSGSGLGLAIVKKHVSFLKGQIDMQSSALGTVFTITLPKEKFNEEY